MVKKQYDELIAKNMHILEELNSEKDVLKQKLDDKSNKTLEKKFLAVCEDIEKIETRLESLKNEKDEAINIHNTYYQTNNKIKDEYFNRTDEALISYFKNGIMQQWASSDILLRKNEEIKILDSIRKSVKWD